MVLLKAGSGEKLEPISEFVWKYFLNNVDPDHLMVQRSMISNLIKTAFADNITTKKVTNVRTIADAMNQNEIYKGMLNEVDKLLRIYFTFPVTSATTERSFYTLRRIKTFLRSSMTQCRLNYLFMLYVHTSKADALDLVSVARDFVSRNA